MSQARIVLVVEVRAGAALNDRIRAAIEAVEPGRGVASVLLVPPADSRADANGGTDAATLTPLVALIQSRGVAAVVAGDARTAAACGADGVHIAPVSAAVGKAYAEARRIVGPGQIVGVEIVDSRHAAMEAGEAGADYLAFSGPDAADLTAWWAEVFEPACVAFGLLPTSGVTDPHVVQELAACGADFVAVAMPAAQTAGDVGDFVRACAEGLNLSDVGASA